MSFPTLIRHDQLKQQYVKPRGKRKPLGETLHIPKITIDTNKPEKVVSAPIVNSTKIVLTKIFASAVLSLIFAIGLMVAPMIASFATSVLWAIGVTANENSLGDFINVAFVAFSLFSIGATWGACHD